MLHTNVFPHTVSLPDSKNFTAVSKKCNTEEKLLKMRSTTPMFDPTFDFQHVMI